MAMCRIVLRSDLRESGYEPPACGWFMGGDTWFSELADELARCLVDARECATACERLLEFARRDEHQKDIFDALVAPIAVSRVLIDLIDHPPQLALAAARLLADSAEAAVVTLSRLEHSVEAAQASEALTRAAASSRRLVEAAR
jgi:hypothetical protein